MSENTTVNVPVWFWVVCGLALIWNLLGVMAFGAQITMNEEALAKLAEAERNLYQTTPMWVNIAFGCAVIGGALGCIGLLLRKSWSIYILIISLMGVLAQMSHVFFVSNAIEVYGPGQAIMPVMIILIAFLLVWFSNWTKNKGWLS